VNIGGCPFACDPSLPAPRAPAIWRPEILPLNIILVRAPDSFAGTSAFDASDLTPATADVRSLEGRHIVLPDLQGDHRLWLPELHSRMPLAALIPLDEDVLLRIAGLLRFRRRLTGRPAGPLPQAWRLTVRQRRRLVLMVRALDGHLAKASYREIAEVLYGPEQVARYPWKTSSIRGQTIRLVKDAVTVMNGGYRRLLRGER
jgi:hypothetical protein